MQATNGSDYFTNRAASANWEPLLAAAREYYAAGLNVLPALREQKRPVGSWKRWTKERPEFDEVFRPGVTFDALCVVCGATSGGLEIIDFDQQGIAFPAWRELVGRFMSVLTVESTQRGGKHVGYRCAEFGRNMKLANNDQGCTIETRGEGGICLIAPSPGYEVEAGDWRNLPTISATEREKLLDAARRLDETQNKTPKFVENRQKPSEYCPKRDFFSNNGSVADYMRELRSGIDALLRHGWTYLRTEGDFDQYMRPGQPVPGKLGLSYNVQERYYRVFTSSAAPLEPDRTYSDLQLVAELDFGGDVSACATQYGKDSDFMPISHVVKVIAAPRQDEESSPTKPRFDFAAPTAGGLIGDLCELTMKYSLRPQPEGALLGALAAQSFLCGRSIATTFNGTLVTPNLYCLFLAPSGMGKEAIRRTNSAVMQAYNPSEVAPESFASVQALQNLISRVKKVFWLHDEFGRDLSVMTGRSANANTSSIITECLKLYSSAGNARYKPKLVAGEAKGVKPPAPVDRPSLTIFATGNPSEFFDAAGESVLTNGYVARFSIMISNEYVKKRTIDFEEAQSAPVFSLPRSIVRVIRQWRNFENQTSKGAMNVPFERSAFELLRDFDETNERKLRESIESSDGIGEVRARFSEKSWKYALLFAASRYGPCQALTIDRSSAELAVALTEYESRLFDQISARFGSTETSRFCEKILEWARGRGAFTRRDFTRRFQRVEKRIRDEALQTLLDAERLTACEWGDGERRLRGYYVADDSDIH